MLLCARGTVHGRFAGDGCRLPAGDGCRLPRCKWGLSESQQARGRYMNGERERGLLTCCCPAAAGPDLGASVAVVRGRGGWNCFTCIGQSLKHRKRDHTIDLTLKMICVIWLVLLQLHKLKKN